MEWKLTQALETEQQRDSFLRAHTHLLARAEEDC